MKVKIRDLAAEAHRWAAEEIQLAVRAGDPALGGAVILSADEEYGVAITWVIVTAPNAAGQPAQLPVWFLAVTHRSPLPATPAMVDCQQIGTPEPDEATVRIMAGNAVRSLRANWASQLAAGNGTGP